MGMLDDKAGQWMILRKENWILGFIGQVCIPQSASTAPDIILISKEVELFSQGLDVRRGIGAAAARYAMAAALFRRL